MTALDSIRDTSAHHGWVVDRVSDDGRTATFVKGALEVTVRYTIKGAVYAAWNGNEEITGRGKREAVIAILTEETMIHNEGADAPAQDEPSIGLVSYGPGPGRSRSGGRPLTVRYRTRKPGHARRRRGAHR